MRDGTVAVGAICLLVGFAAGRGGGVSGLAVGDGYQALAPAYDGAGDDLPLEAAITLSDWHDCADDGGLFTVDPNAVTAGGKVQIWCDLDLPEGFEYTGPTHLVTSPTSSLITGDTPVLADIPVPSWTRCAEVGGIYTIEPFDEGAAAGCFAPLSMEAYVYTLKVQGMELDNDELVYVSVLEEEGGDSGPIVVERAFTGPDDLYQWRLDVEEGFGEPKPISIVSSDGLGGVTYPAVYPIRWESPEMTTSGIENSIERITFQAVDSGSSISRTGEYPRKPSRVDRGGSRPVGSGVPGRTEWGRQR